MPSKRDAKKRLDSVPGGQRVAVAIWEEDDVLGYAQEMGLECSRRKARQIIDDIDRKQDCELGITWTTLDVHLQE